MAEPLALKYRPKSFQDMIGQRLNAIVLQQMVSAEQVPSALLFSGPSGVGKTTAARILASAMEATDTIEIDAASNGGVGEVRKLLDVVRYSTGGSWRVVILDEAQSITRQGFEAFLKTLEEPPAGTVFVLVTTEPHKIPDTILSRLVEFQFRAIPASEVLDRLVVIAQRESIDIEPDLLHHLAQRADGNVRTAIQALDMAARARVRTVQQYKTLAGEHDPAPSLLAALMTGNHERIFALLDEQLSTIGSPGQIAAELVSCIRDLFVMKAGGSLSVTGASFDSRRELALRLEQERLLFAVKTLWEVKTRIRGSDDPRGTLELALILIAEAFTRGKATPTPAAAPQQPLPTSATPQAAEVPRTQPRKLSLAELQRER